MGTPIYVYAFIIGLASISAGYVIGYASPATTRLEAKFLEPNSLVYQFASIMNIGALLGCLTVNRVMDQQGRKGALRLTTVPCLVGWGCIILGLLWADGGQTASPAAGTTGTNPANAVTKIPISSLVRLLLVTGRFLTGVSCGAMMTVASVFLVEIAPTAMRGTLGTCNQLGITVGIFFSYMVGLMLKSLHVNWLNVAGAACPFALLLCLARCPESPRWLLQRGHRTEALNALKLLRFPVTNVDEELKDYEDSLCSESSTSGESGEFNWRELMRLPLRSPMWRVVCLMLAQQLSGINAVMFYAETIFANTGVGTSAASYVALLGLAQVIFTLGATRVVDLYGRKLLLQAASALMTVALFALAMTFRASSGPSLLPVVCLVLFMLGFSLGWGPVPSLMAVELFPLRARSTAGGVAIGVSWLSSFLVTSTFPHMLATVGPSLVFLTFSVACVLAGTFVSKCIPETKGRSLEDIQMSASVSKMIV